MTIRMSTLLFMGYLYFLLPLMVFILGWLKLIYGIPVFLICCYVGYLLYKDSMQNKNSLSISLNAFILICLSMATWILVEGVIGLFPQSSDMVGRNAMFRDLVELPWPVIYSKGGAVVYYHGVWLVPALLGKIFGYTMGLVFLLLWLALGLSIMMLLLYKYLDINSLQGTTILILLVIGMGGILGFEGVYYDNLILISHTATNNVYYLNNQIVGVWLLAMLFMFQHSTRNFVFLGISSILYSPYIITALIPLMLVKVYEYRKEKDIVQQIFSKNNILVSLVIFPILYLYFIGNGTIAVAGDSFYFMLTKDNIYRWICIISMFFLIYAIIIFPSFKRDPMFYVTVIISMFLSTIRYGHNHNFGRSLLLPIFILTIYVFKYLFTADSNSIRRTILILLLAFASGGNFNHINNQILSIGRGVQPMQYNDYRTTSDTQLNNEWANKNYKKTIFFKYLAK